MPVSRTRKQIRYSLTRSVTLLQVDSTTSGASSVVSRTRNRLMPSTPTW